MSERAGCVLSPRIHPWCGVVEVSCEKGGFPRWLDRLLSVGGGCVAGLVVLLFLPGLVAWAVSGDAELGRSLTRVLVGWGFGPVAVFCGLYWFALPYWGTSSVLKPSWEMRCAAVLMGSCFWGAGAGFSAWALGASALFALRLGLVVGAAGVAAGLFLARWLGRVAGVRA